MKLRSLYGAVLFVCLAGAAHAGDLTVRFTGKFVTSTCSFTANDAALGSFGAWTFTGVTVTFCCVVSVAPVTLTTQQKVTVTPSNCTPDVTTVHMKFTGTADPNNSGYFKAISTAGNVTGVGIKLVNGSAVQATPNTTVWPIKDIDLDAT